MAWWFMLFLQTFPECHCRLNTELLNVCNTGADFSFFFLGQRTNSLPSPPLRSRPHKYS